MHRLVGVALFSLDFGRFTDGFRAGDKWRKTFEELIEHFAAREQLFNRYANLDTIITGLFKGAIIAVRGHFVLTSQR